MPSDLNQHLPCPWHQSSIQAVWQQHQQHRLPHALLLCGEAGIGKSLLARYLAQLFLCEQQQVSQTVPRACGVCASCQLYLHETHPDFIGLTLQEKSSTIKIDQVRALRETLQSTRYGEGLRIVIIDPAEKLNQAAQNALLKIVEEPPPHTLFLLSTAYSALLNITLRSRCLRLKLTTPQRTEVESWLLAVSGVDVQQVHAALQLALGRPLLALHYLESDTLNYYQRLLGLMEQCQHDHTLVSTLVRELPDNIGLLAVVDWLQVWVYQMITYKFGKVLTDLTVENELKLRHWSQRSNLENLFALQSSLQQYARQLHTGVALNQSLMMENIVIKWQTLINR